MGNKMPKDIGEIQIIEIFRKYCENLPHIFLGVASPTGIYEDVGAIELGNRRLLIVKTDMIGKKTHIPPKMTYFQMGRKAVVVNMSDLAAKGAEPLGLVFSVGLPSDISIEEIEAIAKGMGTAAKEYHTCIIGGDTNRTDDVILAGMALGVTTKDKILLRSGAQENDIVAVTGCIGGAAIGLYALLHDLEIKQSLLKYILEPRARLAESLSLANMKLLSSAGDISDGLALELHKTSDASNKGMLIEESQLPIDEDIKEFALTNGLNLIDMTLHVGEDFELLYTLPPKNWDKVKRQCEAMDLKITNIGRVTADHKIQMKTREGNIVPIKRKGFDKFLDKI